MSAQSYWGQGPTYGAIHKQDFTADGTGSQVINLNYDIRDSNELLVSIDHLIMEPGVDFILSKDPVKRITISSNYSIGLGGFPELESITSFKKMLDFL